MSGLTRQAGASQTRPGPLSHAADSIGAYASPAKVCVVSTPILLIRTLRREGGRAHVEAAREEERRELARTLRDEVGHADRDYIWKESDPQELVRAAKAALSGEKQRS